MTLKEYLEDYASESTRANGEKVIARELNNIGSEKVHELAKQHLKEISEGKRDFRF